MKKITSWLIINLLVEHAYSSGCSIIPACRVFEVHAAKRYQPDKSFDGILSLNGEVMGSASLNSRPLQFRLPTFLNITNGNSAAESSTVTLSLLSPTVTTAVCTYQGIGVEIPWTDQEIAAANAYKFQDCKDLTTGLSLGLLSGDLVQARQVSVSVINGGNVNPGDVTGIKVVLSEQSNCFQQNTKSMALVGGDTLNQIYSGIFMATISTVDCFPSQTTTKSIVVSSTTSKITLITQPVSLATLSVSNPTQSTSSIYVPTSLEESSTSDMSDLTDEPSSSTSDHPVSPILGLSQNQLIIYGGVAGGGLILLLIVFLTIYVCRRRNKSPSDLEKRGKKPVYESNGTFFSSRETMYPEYSNTNLALSGDLDFDSVYGYYDEQEDFRGSRHNVSTDDLPNEPNVGGGRAHLDCEMTLMNTKAVIALPGFLMMDYHRDLRPDSILAEGGGGVIYQAELLDDRLRERHRVKKVAVKIVKNPANWSDEELLTNFRQEVSIMWSLNFNDHVIKLIGYSEDPMAIVMKYYSLNVGELIKNPQFHDLLNTETVLRFSYHVVNAMKDIHKLGIVHRDLKSINLLIDVPAGSANDPVMWRVVVCDFGLAKPLSDVDVVAEKTADVQGISVRYAAPEVFQRMYVKGATTNRIVSGDEEKKGDVYAYAIIQWELLEKKFIWAGLKNEEIEWHVRNGNRPEVTAEVKDKCFTDPIIELLVRIMQTCWAQEWKDRLYFDEIQEQMDPFFSQIPQPIDPSERSMRMSAAEINYYHSRQTTGGTRSSMHKKTSRPISSAINNTQTHARANTFNGNKSIREGKTRSRYLTSNENL